METNQLKRKKQKDFEAVLKLFLLGGRVGYELCELQNPNYSEIRFRGRNTKQPPRCVCED